ncbi:MAG: hypothetical protein JNL12_15990 [Planctomycetes bacterium]|nr:hypothetical protein [Planctomycetota bacterium]
MRLAPPLLLALTLPLPCLTGQAVTLLDGPATGPVDVQVRPCDGGPATAVLDEVLLRAVQRTTRTANEEFEWHQPRIVADQAGERLEWPDGTRLYAFERTVGSGHGLLLVPTNGLARIVYEGAEQLDLPLAAPNQPTHVAFVRGPQVVLVKLDGVPFAGTASTVRTVALPDDGQRASVVTGPSHVFLVTDDDRLWRIPVAAGGPENITPPGLDAVQSSRLAISGDGNVVAFLRTDGGDQVAPWVVGTSGPCRRLPLPDASYREPAYLPDGDGQPHLVLDHTGSRLMVTEIQAEDELHFVDTGLGGATHWLTRDEQFADYIGSHILPSFVGGRLLFASGHEGWMDWYAVQPDGSVVNVSQTGSPEPLYLLGGLDVRRRLPLGNGQALATESIGTLERLRTLDPNGASTVLFADLTAAPERGASLSGPADLRVQGLGGERLLRGSDGSTLLALPAGVKMSPPVRGPQGWTVVEGDLGGVYVPAVFDETGTLLAVVVTTEPRRWSWTAAGELVAKAPGRLEVFSATGLRVLSLGTSPTRVVSGAMIPSSGN